jgi:hypothetical protein
MYWNLQCDYFRCAQIAWYYQFNLVIYVINDNKSNAFYTNCKGKNELQNRHAPVKIHDSKLLSR